MKQIAVLFVGMMLAVLCLGEMAGKVFAGVPDLPKALSVAPSDPHPQVTMLEFSATWCGSCQHIKPAVQAIENEAGSKLMVVPLDVDDQANKPYVKLYHITVIPTFILYNSQGKAIKRIDYGISGNDLRNIVMQATEGH